MKRCCLLGEGGATGAERALMHAEAQVHLIVVSFQSSLLSTAIVVDKSSSVKKKKLIGGSHS